MITTVCLNAGIDKVYYIEEELVAGTVMRVKRVQNSAGGKGIIVARMVQLCGGQSLATGFVGGHNGAYLQEMLVADGVESKFTSIAGETRSCVNVIDSRYGSTEFLEPGASITAEELQRFLDDYKQIVKKSELIILSGSIAQGLPETIYETLVNIAHEASVKVILDSSGEPFRHGLRAKPTIVKPNQFELGKHFNVQIQTVDQVIHYGKKLAEEGIEYVIVSLGENGAILIHQDGIYHAVPPKIVAVNPAGCGDALVAGFAEALNRRLSLEDCLRFAVAAGSANALKAKTGDMDYADFENLYEQLKVIKFE